MLYNVRIIYEVPQCLSPKTWSAKSKAWENDRYVEIEELKDFLNQNLEVVMA